MEYNELPDCCKRALKQIEAQLEAAKLLSAIVKISPDLVSSPWSILLPFSVTQKVPKLLWGLAKTGYKYDKFRRETKGIIVSKYAAPNVSTIIQNKQLDHINDPELETYWENIAKGLNL